MRLMLPACVPKRKYMKETVLCLVVDEVPNATEKKAAYANGARAFIFGADAGLFG